MKTALLLTALFLSLSFAQQVEPPRDGVDFFFGYGAWLPGLLNDDSQLAVGSQFLVGIETPMFQANQFRISAGPAFCSSDRTNFDGITAIMVNVGYRTYPFFRRYAGPRAIEPFIGAVAGGIIVWDRIADTFEQGESKSTGGAMLGAELGTRVKLSNTMFFDLTLTGEWVPIGSAIAGETEKDLSGLRIQGSLVF